MNTETIAGVEFRAIRKHHPIPHWLPQVVETGATIEAGVFAGHSRPAMWDSIRYMAQRIGEDRLRRDLVGAKP